MYKQLTPFIYESLAHVFSESMPHSKAAALFKLNSYWVDEHKASIGDCLEELAPKEMVISGQKYTEVTNVFDLVEKWWFTKRLTKSINLDDFNSRYVSLSSRYYGSRLDYRLPISENIKPEITPELGHTKRTRMGDKAVNELLYLFSLPQREVNADLASISANSNFTRVNLDFVMSNLMDGVGFLSEHLPNFYSKFGGNHARYFSERHSYKLWPKLNSRSMLIRTIIPSSADAELLTILLINLDLVKSSADHGHHNFIPMYNASKLSTSMYSEIRSQLVELIKRGGVRNNVFIFTHTEPRRYWVDSIGRLKITSNRGSLKTPTVTPASKNFGASNMTLLYGYTDYGRGVGIVPVRSVVSPFDSLPNLQTHEERQTRLLLAGASRVHSGIKFVKLESLDNTENTENKDE